MCWQGGGDIATKPVTFASSRLQVNIVDSGEPATLLEKVWLLCCLSGFAVLQQSLQMTVKLQHLLQPEHRLRCFPTPRQTQHVS